MLKPGLALSKKQRRFLHAKLKRINILEGSVRSGKTYISLFKFVKTFIEMLDVPGGVAIIGRTQDTIKRNLIRDLEFLLGNNFKYYSGKREAHLFGYVIDIVGASDEKAEKVIRGSTFKLVLVDELTLMPESFFIMLLSRMSPPGAKLIGTTNPDSPGHWLKKNYLDRKNKLDMLVIKFLLSDNPSLDKTYVKNLKKEYIGLWYKRFILGLWVIAEGAIYDFFDSKRHVVTEPPGEAVYYIIGIDYGTSNPTAAILIGVNKDYMPFCWAEREYYYDPSISGKQRTDYEHSQAIKRWLGNDSEKVRATYVDPSAASFKLQLKKDKIPFVKDAINDVLDGIRTQAVLLANGKYVLCRKCEQAIEDYGAYVWDAKASEDGEDKPLKQNDHISDAQRYALHTHFGGNKYDLMSLID